MENSKQASIEDQLKMDSQRPTKICGIVRPIAAMGTYTADHWQDVHGIVASAIAQVGYEARLVSEAESVGIILGSIVTNLYTDEIVICDVSGKNPNVMFELGMRVAFEKPVIIITDDETPFSFDVSPVKHLVYPRTLRHPAMVRLQTELAAAIPATVEASKRDDHRGYLQQFGPIKSVELGTREFSASDLAEEIQEIRRSIRALEKQSSLGQPNISMSQTTDEETDSRVFAVAGSRSATARKILDRIGSLPFIKSTKVMGTKKIGGEEITLFEVTLMHKIGNHEAKVIDELISSRIADLSQTPQKGF